MSEVAPALPEIPVFTGLVAPSETIPDSQNTAAPETVETPTEGDPGEQPEPPKGKNWAARKIDQLTKEKAEANAERLRLLAIVERGGQPPPQQRQPQADQGPTREQFSDYETYLEARAAWVGTRRADERFAQLTEHMSKAQREQHAQREAASIVGTMQERIAEGAKAIPDFDTVVTEASDMEIGHAASAIATSENPAGVIHYLATHPEAAQKIAKLSPVAAAREVGKIEASLSLPPKPSNAPAPGKPVGARGGPTNGYREDMTMDEFVKWRSKK